MQNTNTTSQQDMRMWLIHAMNNPDKCHFLQSGGNSWKSENSTVTSLPSIDFYYHFGFMKKQNVACSLVSISGPSTESLHFHTSNIIGIATNGSGVIKHCHINESNEILTNVTVGDIIYIPKFVLHLFETKPNDLIEYIAFEISDTEIDYQKHWNSSELTSKFINA